MLLGSPVAPNHGGAAASASEPRVTPTGFGIGKQLSAANATKDTSTGFEIGNQLSATNATKETPEKSKEDHENAQDHSMMQLLGVKR